MFSYTVSKKHDITLANECEPIYKILYRHNPWFARYHNLFSYPKLWSLFAVF